MRRFLTIVFSAVLLLALAMPASATTSTTDHSKTPVSFPIPFDSNGCPTMNPGPGAQLYLFTLTPAAEVLHLTVNDAGDYWLTETATGDVTFVPLGPYGTTWSGHGTIWDNFNQNVTNGNMSAILEVSVASASGETLKVNANGHVQWTGDTPGFFVPPTPDQITNQFFDVRCH